MSDYKSFYNCTMGSASMSDKFSHFCNPFIGMDNPNISVGDFRCIRDLIDSDEQGMILKPVFVLDSLPAWEGGMDKLSDRFLYYCTVFAGCSDYSRISIDDLLYIYSLIRCVEQGDFVFKTVVYDSSC